jgi:DNA-binding response OmpR family regulator
MAGIRVLIVEDEFLIRLTLTEALSDEGFDVVAASTGDEAVRLAAETPEFALLLTDVQLPGDLDGIAVARSLRERVPDLPVIFMTGRPDSTGAVDASDRNMTIAKPYLIADICAAAKRLTAA